MLQIGVKSTIDDVIAKLKVFDEDQFPFAISKAINDTAVEARDSVRASMPSRFTLRRDWVVKGIQVVPATKQNLSAIVWSRDEFMGLQETGGEKHPFGKYLAVPLPAVKPNAMSIIDKANRPRNIAPTLTPTGAKRGQTTSVITLRNGKKFIARVKPGATKKDRIEFLYLLVPTATLRSRLGLEEITQKVVQRRFVANLERAINDAMRTARAK